MVVAILMFKCLSLIGIPWGYFNNESLILIQAKRLFTKLILSIGRIESLRRCSLKLIQSQQMPFSIETIVPIRWVYRTLINPHSRVVVYCITSIPRHFHHLVNQSWLVISNVPLRLLYDIICILMLKFGHFKDSFV